MNDIRIKITCEKIGTKIIVKVPYIKVDNKELVIAPKSFPLEFMGGMANILNIVGRVGGVDEKKEIEFHIRYGLDDNGVLTWELVEVKQNGKVIELPIGVENVYGWLMEVIRNILKIEDVSFSTALL